VHLRALRSLATAHHLFPLFALRAAKTADCSLSCFSAQGLTHPVACMCVFVTRHVLLNGLSCYCSLSLLGLKCNTASAGPRFQKELMCQKLSCHEHGSLGVRSCFFHLCHPRRGHGEPRSTGPCHAVAFGKGAKTRLKNRCSHPVLTAARALRSLFVAAVETCLANKRQVSAPVHLRALRSLAKHFLFFFAGLRPEGVL